MKNNIILLFLLLSFAINAQKNTTDFSTNIPKTINLYRELFLAKNFESLSDFGSPKLIEHLSTKQDLVYLMTELNNFLESKGAKISNIIFGENSEIIKYNTELQCSIPFILELEDSSKKTFITSGLALVSFNNGKSWFFTFKVDKDNSKNNQILGLDNNIVIPERSQKFTSK